MISILMPAHIDSSEKQAWINEAVKSVQAQSFKEWEIIIVDDASPYSINLDQPDERIKIVRTVNRSGPSLCRNDAAAMAQYDCLFALDADDKLGTPETLATLFLTWERNQDRIIYGDIQQLLLTDGEWRLGKIFNLPEYTFERVMDLSGIIPVSAMHSKECHIRAGGWKSQLKEGLEDIEYWIAAGKAGFCGFHIKEIVLHYRRHLSSRFYFLRENGLEGQMRNLIKELHSDIYEGRFPMGCCGGGRAYVPPPSNNVQEMEVTTLDQVVSNQKVWVEYAGQRQGSFGVVGKFSNISYTVKGPGHKFEVHVNDLPIFQRQRGVNGQSAFLVGVPSPVIQTTKKVPWSEPAFKAPEPELAQILA